MSNEKRPTVDEILMKEYAAKQTAILKEKIKELSDENYKFREGLMDAPEVWGLVDERLKMIKSLKSQL